MPVITVQLLAGRSTAQKRSFIEQVTAVAVGTLGVPAHAVTIVLSQADAEDWGAGGTTMADRRASPPPTTGNA
jgi:4-oxalocrotonate tautomerase